MNGLGLELITSASDGFLLERLAPLRASILGVDPEAREFLSFCVPLVERSHAQILQDLFVLYMLGEKRGGFFVDFGATDGVELSNSYLLEKGYGWTGIVAEPSRHFHADLRRNRACAIDLHCVSESTGRTATFHEITGSGLSSMAEYVGDDWHSEARRNSIQYDVRTISLNDLLDRHLAPASIDYLSIDTEGSEFAILASFDFDARSPKIITVEHNFVDEKRGAIFRLLTAKGYRRRFETLSMFDDWYVHSSLERGAHP